jgi:hypothetical protein
MAGCRTSLHRKAGARQNQENIEHPTSTPTSIVGANAEHPSQKALFEAVWATRFYKDIVGRQQAYTSLYKAIQGYTRVFDDFCEMHSQRGSLRLQFGETEAFDRRPDRRWRCKGMRVQRKPFCKRIGHAMQALARLCKRMQGYFDFFYIWAAAGDSSKFKAMRSTDHAVVGSLVAIGLRCITLAAGAGGENR